MSQFGYAHDKHKSLGDHSGLAAVKKLASARGKVDIGTAIAINRNGPVKPGTNKPLMPKRIPGRKVY